MKKSICFWLSFVFIAFLYAGKVDTIQIMSYSMHKQVKCVVITPESYLINKNSYSVIYLLHGYAGNYAQWIRTAPQLKQKTDEIQSIIVCPDGGYDSWYFNSDKDTNVKYETFISKELVNYIDSNYRTIANRNCRAITGLSMGGHGAMYLAIKHSGVFGTCGATSGGVDLTPFPNNWGIKNVLGDTSCCSANWVNNSVINMVDLLHNHELSIILDCGTEDFFLDVNRRLHKKLLNLRISHDYIERSGAHNSNYWENSIDYQLLFFKKCFSSHAANKVLGIDKKITKLDLPTTTTILFAHD